MDWWSRCTLHAHVGLQMAEIDCEGNRFNFRNGCYRLELEFPFDIDTADDSMYVAKVRRARDGEDYPVLEARLPKAKVGPTSNMDLLCVGLQLSKMSELVRIQPSGSDKTPFIQVMPLGVAKGIQRGGGERFRQQPFHVIFLFRRW